MKMYVCGRKRKTMLITTWVQFSAYNGISSESSTITGMGQSSQTFRRNDSLATPIQDSVQPARTVLHTSKLLAFHIVMLSVAIGEPRQQQQKKVLRWDWFCRNHGRRTRLNAWRCTLCTDFSLDGHLVPF